MRSRGKTEKMKKVNSKKRGGIPMELAFCLESNIK